MDLESRMRVLDRERVVELRYHSSPETDHAHDRIRDSHMRHPLPGCHRRDFDRLVVQHKAQGVRIMHRYVENHAAARFSAVDSPSLQKLRKVDRVKNPGGERRPDRPVRDQLPQLAMGDRVAEVMIGRHDHTCLLAGGDHSFCTLERQRERLLAKHMLTRRRCC